MSLECVMGFVWNGTRKTHTQRVDPAPTPKKPQPVHFPSTLEEARRVVLTFGKYTGRPINTVPRTYLRWLVNNHGPQDSVIQQTAVAAARLLLESP